MVPKFKTRLYMCCGKLWKDAENAGDESRRHAKYPMFMRCMEEHHYI
jgi:hypothetical protein